MKRKRFEDFVREKSTLKIPFVRKRLITKDPGTNIIVRSNFKREIGEVADVISFCREFLNRIPSPAQKDDLIEIFGTQGGEWSRKFSEVVLAVGMKGGKNFLAEIIVSYACYFISCLRDPHHFFTKLVGREDFPYTAEKNFDIVNVSSVDESQARRVFFDTVKNVFRLTRDPRTGDNFFERYAGLDLRPGGFGDMKSKIIVFPAKQPGMGSIRLMSFNSTATAPEGVHCLLFLADELSRADTKAKYMEAAKLYDLGMNNTTASFPGGVGKVIGWSYLNDTDFDLTNDRYEASLSDPTIYGKKYKTWEYNPAQKKENFQKQYDSDPVKARQVFECIKPTSRDNFFQPYVHKLDQAIRPEVEQKITYKISSSTKHTQGKQYEFTTLELLSVTGDTRTRCFAADPAKSKDRFVIAGGYLETIDTLKLDIFLEDKPTVISTNKRPVIDIIIVVEPIPGKPIDYLSIGDVFTQIIRHFPNTKSINSDHFQNEKLRQEIIKQGIASETYFFSNQQQLRLYTIFRANIWNNNIKISGDEKNRFEIANKYLTAKDLFLQEAKQLIKDGGKIDHPANGSKDLIDAIAIVNHDLMNIEARNEFMELTEENLSRLAEKFMQEKYKLLQENLPETRILEEIQIKFCLSAHEIKQLSEYVKTTYNY